MTQPLPKKISAQLSDFIKRGFLLFVIVSSTINSLKQIFTQSMRLLSLEFKLARQSLFWIIIFGLVFVWLVAMIWILLMCCVGGLLYQYEFSLLSILGMLLGLHVLIGVFLWIVINAYINNLQFAATRKTIKKLLSS